MHLPLRAECRNERCAAAVAHFLVLLFFLLRFHRGFALPELTQGPTAVSVPSSFLRVVGCISLRRPVVECSLYSRACSGRMKTTGKRLPQNAGFHCNGVQFQACGECDHCKGAVDFLL